jgi:hypothetical protein
MSLWDGRRGGLSPVDSDTLWSLRSGLSAPPPSVARSPLYRAASLGRPTPEFTKRLGAEGRVFGGHQLSRRLSRGGLARARASTNQVARYLPPTQPPGAAMRLAGGGRAGTLGAGEGREPHVGLAGGRKDARRPGGSGAAGRRCGPGPPRAGEKRAEARAPGSARGCAGRGRTVESTPIPR